MSLNDFRPMMERCSNCLNCRWIPYDKMQSIRFGENCPSVCFNNFNTYTARGRFQLAQSMLDGRTPYTDTVVDIIHNCTACGACDVACKVCRYNLEPLAHNLELKAKAVQDGKHLPEQKVIIEGLRKEKTMIVGERKANRMLWLKNLGIKDLLDEDAEVAFFAGCKYSYDEKLQKIAKDTIQILVSAGVDLGTLGSGENCCAGRAYQMGFRNDFQQSAKANIKTFRDAGVKTIVTPCSDCYHTFKRLYADMGLEIEILHTVEYLERLLKEGKIKFTKPMNLNVTYHDPCHLGRLGETYQNWQGKEVKIFNQIHTWEPRRPRYSGAEGIYDAPRNIINNIPGVSLVEMERIREYAWCCGAGGGCSETYPEFSTWTASERIAEANQTNADALVTACPWCKTNFENVEDENGNKMRILDIIELVKLAM